jgi:hypothetical protein
VKDEDKILDLLDQIRELKPGQKVLNIVYKISLIVEGEENTR